MKKMYPYCEILFKITDEPGWILGKMNGGKAIVEEKCSTQKWFKYQVYDGCSCAWEISDKYPVEIDPYNMHLRSNWIFSNELNRIFLPEEIIPIPRSNAIISDDLHIKFNFNQEDNNINDLIDLHEDKIKYRGTQIINTYPEIAFELNRVSYRINAEYSTDIDNRLSSFINGLIYNKYSYFIIDEYNYTKFLAWCDGVNCRFKIQNYDEHNAVFEPIDVIIKKNVLINVLMKFKVDILNEHNKLIEIVKSVNRNV